LVLVPGLTVVQLHEQVAGVEQVGEALGGERAGARVFVFEVVPDSSHGFGDRWGDAAGTAPPHTSCRRRHAASSGMRRFSSAKSSPIAWRTSWMAPSKASGGITICHTRVMFSRSSSPSSGNIHAMKSGVRSAGMPEA